MWMSESLIYKHKNYSGYAFLSCNLEWINYIGLGFHSALFDFGFVSPGKQLENSSNFVYSFFYFYLHGTPGWELVQ
jgi:hypothetical protein